MDDLKFIKKNYGEKMMKLCRELFPIILETPGKLSKIMLEHFEPTKFLYTDIVSNNLIDKFKNYIYSFIDMEKADEIGAEKKPEQLLSEAGYILYECKTEAEIQEFKKFYAEGEELCTFRGGRLNTCYVFFAVKKNVDEIKRENFSNPLREDEYGTSVISIQFARTKPNTLSIKNRYNHRVNNPDNTFNNNLDNIIKGLTKSFKVEYKLEFSAQNQDFEIPGYVSVEDKWYKYNYEINNVYYCPNNIIIDNYEVIDKYSKRPERYIVIDQFIIDLEGEEVELNGEKRKIKTIKPYDKKLEDSFPEFHKNIERINVIVDKTTGNKTLEITYDNGKLATIVINKRNQMVEYHNDFLQEMPDFFLRKANKLQVLDVKNLIKIGKLCLDEVSTIESIQAPKLLEIGNYSLRRLKLLTEFIAPNLIRIGTGVLCDVPLLKSFQCSNLTVMGNSCLTITNLTKFIAPNLISMGNYCLQTNKLVIFSAEKLKQIGTNCLEFVTQLENVNVPSLENIGESCLRWIPHLLEFSAPNLIIMGEGTLKEADRLRRFFTPKLKRMGSFSLELAPELTEFIAPNLEEIGIQCLDKSTKLPNLEQILSSVNKFKISALEKEEYDEFAGFGFYGDDSTIDNIKPSSKRLSERVIDIIKNNLYKLRDFKNILIKKSNGGRNR